MAAYRLKLLMYTSITDDILSIMLVWVIFNRLFVALPLSGPSRKVTSQTRPTFRFLPLRDEFPVLPEADRKEGQ